MKKLLAIILALTVIGGALPAASAAEAEEAANVLYYEFSTSAVGTDGVALGGTQNPAASSTKMVYTPVSDEYSPWEYKLTWGSYNRYFLPGGCMTRLRTVNVKTSTSNATVMKLTSDQSGVFSTEFTYLPHKYGASLTLYLVNGATVASNSLDMTDSTGADIKSALALADTVTVGSVNTVDESYAKNDDYTYTGLTAFAFDNTKSETLNNVNLNTGDYYLVIVADGYGEWYDYITYKEDGTVNQDFDFVYGLYKSLKFTEALPASVSVTAGDSTLAAGGTTTLTPAVKDADGNVLEGAPVTYTSSSDAVASVAEDGTVTANAPGVATITATTSNGKTATVDIAVGSDIYSYVFTSAVSGQSAQFIKMNLDISDYKLIDEADGSAKWTYLGERSTNWCGPVEGGLSVNIKKEGVIAKGNIGVSFRISVEESGVYFPAINYSKFNLGGVIDAYIIDEKTAYDNNWDMSVSAGGIKHSMTNLTPVIAGVDTYDEAVEKTFGGALHSAVSEAGLKLEKGEYYFVLGMSGLNSALDSNPDDGVLSNANNIYALVNSLDLVKTADWVPAGDAELGTAVETKVYVSAPDGAVASDQITAGSVETIAEAYIGKTITLTAESELDDGSTFAYWRDMSTGSFLGADLTYSFPAIAKHNIEAVYDAPQSGNTATVELWNMNGELVKTIENVALGTEFDSLVTDVTASMTGYSDYTWSAAGTTITRLTRAVAQYTGTSEDALIGDAITADITVNAAAQTDLYYDKAITAEADGEKVWKRNDRAVFYGTSYTYYPWSATRIRSSSGAFELKPFVVLDKNGNGEYMLEYFAPDGYELVEAGILFGGDSVSIESFVSRAKVKSLKTHGQFTASAHGEEAAARGYIIYKVGTVYKIAYSI